jgi:tetratricopeptide (TPR) repeat protein
MSAISGLPDFDALWDYDRPDASERAFRELLPLAASAEAETYRLELLTQIARAQGLQRRFDDAQRALDHVELGSTALAPRVRIRCLLERGRVLNSSGSPQQAAPLFKEAWHLGLHHGEDALAVDAAHMLGIVAPTEDRLAWNLRALDLAERSADSRARIWHGSLLNNIGWTYHDQGQYEEALATFHRALAVREAEGEEKSVSIARWCVARTLRSLGQIDEALAMQNDLLVELSERSESDGYVHEELAECLLALGSAEEARTHFALAHVALSADPWFVANEPARLRRLGELGRSSAENSGR